MGKLKDLRRRFLGKVAYHESEDKTERCFNNKALKVYLKGHETFCWGSNIVNGVRVPNRIAVPQSWE